MESAEYCPHAVACPPSTILCGNLLHCGVSDEQCSRIDHITCPPHAPLLCADGITCVISPTYCPTTPFCPPGQVRCENGVCRNSTKECTMVSPCPADRPVRCPDGSCSSKTNPTCTSGIVCPLDFVLTTDGRCMSLKGHGGELITSAGRCPSSMVTCPDKTCAISLNVCPSIISCPPGLVRCHDGSCRSSVSLCPGNTPFCPSPHILCPNKQCVLHAEDCIPGIICPPSRPVLCPQGICAVSMRACLQNALTEVLHYMHYRDNEISLQQQQFSGGKYARPFYSSAMKRLIQLAGTKIAGDGALQGSSTVENEKNTLSLIPSDEAVSKEDGEFVDPSVVLVQLACPHAFPFSCPFSPRCVASLTDCPSLLPCPSSHPHRCFDGRCAVSHVQCPSAEDYDDRLHCPIGYVLCPLTDICKPSYALCPTRRVCAEGETLCVDGSCRAAFGLPSTTPSYLTASGVVGQLVETFMVGDEYDKSLEELRTRAINTCVQEKTTAKGFDRSCCNGNACEGPSYEQCVQAKIAKTLQTCTTAFRHYPCEDCVHEGDDTDNNSNNNNDNIDKMIDDIICPPSRKRCPSGHCIALTESCPNIPLCPRHRPVRCMNGLCVISASLCEKQTLCPAGQVVCEDGSCAQGYQQCSSIQCPEERPVLCWDQSCRKSVKDCPVNELCTDGRVFCAVTGECVYDRSTCISSKFI